MVARVDKRALPAGGLPKAPTLMDCFLEALSKRDARDRNPQVTISPSASPLSASPISAGPLSASLAADRSPVAPDAAPVASTQADLFSK